MKQSSSADCQIPQTVADWWFFFHIEDTQLVSYLYITSPESKKMKNFFRNSQDRAKRKTAKLLYYHWH